MKTLEGVVKKLSEIPCKRERDGVLEIAHCNCLKNYLFYEDGRLKGKRRRMVFQTFTCDECGYYPWTITSV